MFGWRYSAAFYHQLAVILRAGTPVAQALELAGKASGGRYAQLARGWCERCSRGESVADTLRLGGEPPLAVALVRAGENTGDLPGRCQHYAELVEQRIALRDTLISRSVYPLFLLHAGLVVPAIPGWIAGSADLSSVFIGPLVLWLVAGAMAGAGVMAQRSGLLATVALLPGVRFLSMPLITSNCCAVLGAGLSAGMLTPAALELAAGASGNRVIASRLAAAAGDVLHRRLPDLASALKKADFPADVIDLVHTGEQSGTTDMALSRAANLARASFASRSQWTARILTGLITAGVMLFVAVTIVRMFSGIYSGVTAAAAEF